MRHVIYCAKDCSDRPFKRTCANLKGFKVFKDSWADFKENRE